MTDPPNPISSPNGDDGSDAQPASEGSVRLWDALKSHPQPEAHSDVWPQEQKLDASLSSATPLAVAEDGRYTKGALLGEGGMGRVWSSQDLRLQRSVALKELPAGTSEQADLRARLAREAWITAQLEHPGIVPVYDAGQRSDGSLYYAMRMIRGRSLQEILETCTLPERLLLLRHFLDVCEAIAYAHSIGIIHRDLKPQNVMLGEFGETYVVDWGLARSVHDTYETPRLDGGLDVKNAVMTRLGDIIGTPHYMSPEQAQGLSATKRSDIWSLGVMLHVLLTRTTPVQGDAQAVLQHLRSGSPVLPTRLADDPEIPAELATIAQQALQPDPDARYPSAKAFADDIASWLAGRRVLAYDYSRWELLRRFIKAWRIPLTVAAGAVLVLAVIGTFAFVRIANEQARTSQAEREARVSLVVADRNLSYALIEQALTLASLGARPEAETLAAHALLLKESPEARGVLAQFSATARPQRLRIIEADQLPDCESRTLSSHGQSLLCVKDARVSLWNTEPFALRWSIEQKAIKGAVFDMSNRVWLYTAQHTDLLLDGSTGHVISKHDLSLTSGRKPFQIFHNVAVAAARSPSFIIYNSLAQTRVVNNHCAIGAQESAVAISQDTSLKAQFCNDNQELHITSTDRDPQRFEMWPLEGGFSVMAFSPDHAFIVGGNTRGNIVLIDRTTGAIVRQYNPGLGAIAAVAFSSDGSLIIVSGQRGGIMLWSPVSGAVLGRLPASAGTYFRLSSEERTLVTLGATLQHWQLPSVMQPYEFTPELEIRIGIASASLSPDERTLVANRGDGVISVFAVSDASQIADVDLDPTIDGAVKHGAFSLDGQRYYPVSASHPNLVFDAKTWKPTSREKTLIGRRQAMLEGGHRLHVGYGEEQWLISLAPDNTEKRHKLSETLVDVGTDAQHRWAALLGQHMPQLILRISHATPYNMERILRVPQSASAVAISSDGNIIAVTQRHAVHLIDASRGTPQDGLDARTLLTLNSPSILLDVAFSPDDRRIAVGDLEGNIRVWSTKSGRLLAVLQGHTLRVPWIQFDATGKSLYSASWDGHIRRWNLEHLETPAQEVVQQIERAWGLTQAQALRRSN